MERFTSHRSSQHIMKGTLSGKATQHLACTRHLSASRKTMIAHVRVIQTEQCGNVYTVYFFYLPRLDRDAGARWLTYDPAVPQSIAWFAPEWSHCCIFAAVILSGAFQPIVNIPLSDVARPRPLNMLTVKFNTSKSQTPVLATHRATSFRLHECTPHSNTN